MGPAVGRWDDDGIGLAQSPDRIVEMRSGQHMTFAQVTAMKHLRFSISALMAVVLLVALDCMTFNILLNRPLFDRNLSEVVFFGALPMANILAIGLIRLLTERNRRGRTRPFLVGFEGFGGVALLLFVACTWGAAEPIHHGVDDVLRPLSLRPGNPLFLAGAVTLLLLPQLALASVGGWLVRTYSIVVKRRVAGKEPSLPEVAGRADRIMSISDPSLAGPV
jgi:hypothetical protein